MFHFSFCVWNTMLFSWSLDIVSLCWCHVDAHIYSGMNIGRVWVFGHILPTKNLIGDEFELDWVYLHLSLEVICTALTCIFLQKWYTLLLVYFSSSYAIFISSGFISLYILEVACREVKEETIVSKCFKSYVVLKWVTSYY